MKSFLEAMVATFQNSAFKLLMVRDHSIFLISNLSQTNVFVRYISVHTVQYIIVIINKASSFIKISTVLIQALLLPVKTHF